MTDSSNRGEIARFTFSLIHFIHIQGGPAKVRPTYFFDGNI